MTDAEFMLAVLEQGPATTMEIITRSIAERGCGLTPHSRASDLRRQGHVVHCERVENGARPTYLYRLEVLNGGSAVAGSTTGLPLSAPSNQTTTNLPGDTRCAHKSGAGTTGGPSGMAPAHTAAPLTPADLAVPPSRPVQLELIA